MADNSISIKVQADANAAKAELRSLIEQVRASGRAATDAERAAIAAAQNRVRETRNVIRAERDMGEVGVRSSRAIKAEMDRLDAAMSRLRRSSALVGTDLARATQQVKTRMEELRREMAGVQQGAGTLQSAFGKMAGAWVAFQGAMAAGGLIAAVEEMDRLDARLKISEGSAYAAATAMTEIKRIATETRSPVREVADAYIRFSTAIQNAGGSQAEAVEFTENLTKALKVSGSSAQQTGAVMMQLGQAFQSGVLQGDEFRSVAENGGMVLNYLAKSLEVTRGQLRKMSKEGELTSDVLLNISGSAAEIDRDFARVPRTVSDAFVLATNAFLEAAQKSKALRVVIQGLGEVLLFAARNMGALISTAIISGIAALVISAGGLGAAFTAATGAVIAFRAALYSLPILNKVIIALSVALSVASFFASEIKDAILWILDALGMKPKTAMVDGLSDDLSSLEKQLEGMQAKLSAAIEGVTKKIDEQRKAATESIKEIASAYAAMSSQVEATATDQIGAIKARYAEEKRLIASSKGDTDARYQAETNALIAATQQQIEILKDAARQKTELIDSEYTIASQATRVMYDNERERAQALQNLDNEVMQKKRTVLSQMLSDYRSHIDALNSEAQRNFDAVKAIEDQKRGLTSSTLDKVRSLQQAAMGEYQAYQDKLKQIDELNARARDAIAKGQSEQAIDYAKRAQDVASGIAGAVKENGKELVSQAQATATAIIKITDAEKVAQLALDARKNAHQQAAQAAQVEAQSVSTSMAEISRQLETVNAQAREGLQFTVTSNVEKVLEDIRLLEEFIGQKEMMLNVQSNIDELQDKIADSKIALEEDTFSRHEIEDNAKAVQKEIDNLKKPTSSVHTIFEKRVPMKANGGLIQAFANGGQAFRRMIGRISGPGSSTSDSIPAMLSNGEFVIRASMVRKWGASFFDALNRGMMPPMPKYAMGGAVNLPMSMSGSSEALTVTFRAGDLEAPVKISDRTSRESMKAFARELQKIRLVQG